jgi:5'-nucleotidase/UDP-sugar diphosphatase
MVRSSRKCVIWSAVAVAAALAASGCMSAAPAPQAGAQPIAPSATPAPLASSAIRSDVTDIHPPLPTPGENLAQTAAYQVAAADAAPQPITYAALAAAPTIGAPTQPASRTRTPSSTTAGNTHLVRRGETLYSIARETYGTGKQWRKIALANPGVTAATLKAGENLMIP